jgi:hypothetical protein
LWQERTAPENDCGGKFLCSGRIKGLLETLFFLRELLRGVYTILPPFYDEGGKAPRDRLTDHIDSFCLRPVLPFLAIARLSVSEQPISYLQQRPHKTSHSIAIANLGNY